MQNILVLRIYILMLRFISLDDGKTLDGCLLELEDRCLERNK